MPTLYHIHGTCEVEYAPSQQVQEFFVDDVVDANSEVQAIVAIAKSLLQDRSFQNLIWTRLHVEAVRPS